MGGKGPLGVKLGGMQMNSAIHGVASPLVEAEKEGQDSGSQEAAF